MLQTSEEKSECVPSFCVTWFEYKMKGSLFIPSQTMTRMPWAVPMSRTMRKRRMGRARRCVTSGPLRKRPWTSWRTPGFVHSCCARSASASGPNSYVSSKTTNCWWETLRHVTVCVRTNGEHKLHYKHNLSLHAVLQILQRPHSPNGAEPVSVQHHTHP